MAYIIGFCAAPFIIAFLITLGLKSSYRKKHGKDMNTVGVIVRILLIGSILLAVLLLSKLTK